MINSGSSSLKFNLFKIINQKLLDICNGICENIGNSHSNIRYNFCEKNFVQEIFLKNHKEAFKYIKKILCTDKNAPIKNFNEIYAIGHRVVHGGDFFPGPTIINDEVIKKIKNLITLAPIHNAVNLEGILDCQQEFPGIKQVAVFDTSFFFNLPEKVKKYPIPNNLSEKYHIKKYGFHGISHNWVLKKYINITNKKNSKIISCHLGSGSSVCAIKNNIPIDTSMGLTPLGGIMMGTRSGSLDPSVVTFLASQSNLNYNKINEILNKKSGLLGVSEISSDIRKLFDNNNNNKCKLAIDMFVYRIIKYIGAYIAALGGLDALIFTGGIGENDPKIRQKICEKLEFMNLKLDKNLNSKNIYDSIISERNSKVSIFIIKSNEELFIAHEVLLILKAM
ncbi:MAG: acetate kinase [Clostridia bacterium]|nr:acetate kinase [Clostridia bacterium]